ncbi:MAG: DUF3387 domain-containing protein, partial [Nitrospirae bacterium]|nr:DUF3387 domain-containing protein [Nitrospirota bacterium]
RNIGKQAQDMGLSESEYALYKILAADASSHEQEDKFKGYMVREPSVPYGEKKDTHKELTRSIIESLENLAVIDWFHKDDIQREMRKRIKGILRGKGYQFEEIETLTAKIMDLARVRLAR